MYVIESYYGINKVDRVITFWTADAQRVINNMVQTAVDNIAIRKDGKTQWMKLDKATGDWTSKVV